MLLSYKTNETIRSEHQNLPEKTTNCSICDTTIVWSYSIPVKCPFCLSIIRGRFLLANDNVSNRMNHFVYGNNQ